MLKKLFIIGNGFDLHFNLPTKVSDFKNYLSSQSLYLNDNAKNLYESYGVNWSDFENSLANISIDSIYKDNACEPDYLSEHEYDRDSGITDMKNLTDQLLNARDQALYEMIKKAEKKIRSIESSYDKIIFDNSAIISFNYTSTLESLFTLHRSQICHIHGDFQSQSQLIFGYKNKEHSLLTTNTFLNIEREKEIKKVKNDRCLSCDEIKSKIEEINSLYEYEYDDYYLDQQKEIVNSFYELNKKIFQYEKLKLFLNRYVDHSIDEVVVLGHSMSDVDSEYMEIIEKLIKPNRWVISQFKESPSDRDLKVYSFYERISFCNMEQYLH